MVGAYHPAMASPVAQRSVRLPAASQFAANDQAAVHALVAKYGPTSTAQTYLTSLQRIARMSDAPPHGILHALQGDASRWRSAGYATDPFTVCPLLQRLSRESETSKGRREKALLKYLDAINAIFLSEAAVPGGTDTWKFWKLVTESARRANAKAHRQNFKSAKEVAEAFSLDALAQALDRAGWQPQDQRWLYAAMLRYMPAKRQDYWRAHVLSQPDPALQENQVVVPVSGPVELHLWIYKTAKFNKELPYREALGPELSRAVRESLRARPRKFLFTKADGRPYDDRVQFATWSNGALSAILGKRTTLNSARRAWRESLDPRKNTIAQEEDLATRMNHSASTARNYYQKVG